MLRYLAITTALLLPTIPNSTEKKDSPHLSQGRGNNQSGPCVAFVNNETSNPYTSPAKDGSPHWYTSPEWWLCILGVPTLVFIGLQAKATANATKATEDSAAATLESVRLQQALLRQWVETSDEWEIGHTPYKLIGVTEATVILEFAITNPTNWPLNLVKITTCTGSTGRGRQERPNYELRPSEVYPMRLECLITGDELGRYRDSSLDVEVTILVLFRDVLGKRRFQPFYLTCKDCKPTSLRCSVYPRRRSSR
jgi:hypothetical protein